MRLGENYLRDAIDSGAIGQAWMVHGVCGGWRFTRFSPGTSVT
jgi:hypothetical protein